MFNQMKKKQLGVLLVTMPTVALFRWLMAARCPWLILAALLAKALVLALAMRPWLGFAPRWKDVPTKTWSKKSVKLTSAFKKKILLLP